VQPAKAGPDVFVAPGAVVLGHVSIGKGSSVWYGATLRGAAEGAEGARGGWLAVAEPLTRRGGGQSPRLAAGLRGARASGARRWPHPRCAPASAPAPAPSHPAPPYPPAPRPGDVNAIAIGERTNIQDGVVIHVARHVTGEFGGGPSVWGGPAPRAGAAAAAPGRRAPAARGRRRPAPGRRPAGARPAPGWRAARRSWGVPDCRSWRPCSRRAPLPPPLLGTASSRPRATVIGSGVTVAHGALVHAATVGDGCLVGMGATLLDGVVMEPGSVVAAGALVPPGGCRLWRLVWPGAGRARGAGRVVGRATVRRAGSCLRPGFPRRSPQPPPGQPSPQPRPARAPSLLPLPQAR
jgi:carbonic anhydrase/acetyltransferase-like protein (isoleucine patch superfamily)